MRKLKFITALLLIVALVLTGCGKADKDDDETRKNKDKNEKTTEQTAGGKETEKATGGKETEKATGGKKPTEQETTTEEIDDTDYGIYVGDVVTFGRFSQMHTSEDIDPLEWEVLDVKNGKALLVSVYALGPYYYDKNGGTSVTWENSSLRKWLNNDAENGFTGRAFTEKEREAIVETELENGDSPKYGTSGGNNTYDKVFILSLQDMATYYGWDNDSINGDWNSRLLRCPTEYSKAWGTVPDDSNGGSCMWWLRTVGNRNGNFSYINYAGGIQAEGYPASQQKDVVPALWVNLKKAGNLIEKKGTAGGDTASQTEEDDSNVVYSPDTDFDRARLDDGTIIIYGYHGKETDIVIPKITQNMKITVIGKETFARNLSIESVVIPNTVTTIRDNAFEECKYLKSVIIPNSVTEIGKGVFFACRVLAEIDLPAGLTDIPSQTFSGCEALTRVGIPDTVTTIGYGAFSSCEALTSLTLPDGLVKIEGYAFGRSGLESLTIPDGVTEIGDNAFPDNIVITWKGNTYEGAAAFYEAFAAGK